MPSDAAKKRQALKKKQASARSSGGQKKPSVGAKGSPVLSGEEPSSSGACAPVSGMEALKLSERSCTGNRFNLFLVDKVW